ncbi:hypothetical protein DOE63_28070 [Salmonella enterica subsp. diarizonae serovar 59:z10:-]|nr:hypothetical protein DOE63_28070 [Salmonella enterica subsp. diarizonae serovar 59:z10:-]
MVVPVLKANSMIMVRVVCLLRHICVALAPILNLIAQGVPIALLIVLLEVVTVMRGLVMTAVPGFPLPLLTFLTSRSLRSGISGLLPVILNLLCLLLSVRYLI